MKNKVQVLSYKCEKCNFHKDFLSYEQINIKCKVCGNEMIFYNSRNYNPNNGLKAIKDSNRKNNFNSSFSIEQPVVECPYCHSTNTKKIGIIGRSVSFGLFGFGSGKVGKQFHCNSCGADF